jgi:histone H3/H4
MEYLPKPSITRLARKAGIKSLSDDCHNTVRGLVEDVLNKTASTILIVNSEHQTKTIMVDDVYEALRLMGHNVTESSEIGTTTCVK